LQKYLFYPTVHIWFFVSGHKLNHGLSRGFLPVANPNPEVTSCGRVQNDFLLHLPTPFLPSKKLNVNHSALS